MMAKNLRLKTEEKDYFKTSMHLWLLFFFPFSQIPVTGIEKSLDVYQELICPDKGLCTW